MTISNNFIQSSILSSNKLAPPSTSLDTLILNKISQSQDTSQLAGQLLLQGINNNSLVRPGFVQEGVEKIERALEENPIPTTTKNCPVPYGFLCVPQKLENNQETSPKKPNQRW